MAKRKRLSPAQPDYLTPAPETKSAVPPGRDRPRAPISQVAGDAAASAALEAMADEMRQARDSGRLIQAIPEVQIDDGYLVRDRVISDPAEMQALKDSLADRGQQTAIEVVQLGPDRYGLISGWRRLTAMRALLAETGDSARYGQLLAVLRQPDGAAEAYRSMVEENEIRVGLSYYERARIAARAVEQGVFETEKKALLTLFAAASRAKRSKIRSFLPIYHALDGALRFAGAIPERLGLRLSKALAADPGLANRLRADLKGAPPANPVAEAAVLEAALATTKPGPRDQAPARAAVDVTMDGQVITLTGPGVDAGLARALRGWLKTR